MSYPDDWVKVSVWLPHFFLCRCVPRTFSAAIGARWPAIAVTQFNVTHYVESRNGWATMRGPWAGTDIAQPPSGHPVPIRASTNLGAGL